MIVQNLDLYELHALYTYVHYVHTYVRDGNVDEICSYPNLFLHSVNSNIIGSILQELKEMSMLWL